MVREEIEYRIFFHVKICRLYFSNSFSYRHMPCLKFRWWSHEKYQIIYRKCIRVSIAKIVSRWLKYELWEIPNKLIFLNKITVKVRTFSVNKTAIFEFDKCTPAYTFYLLSQQSFHEPLAIIICRQLLHYPLSLHFCRDNYPRYL